MQDPGGYGDREGPPIAELAFVATHVAHLRSPIFLLIIHTQRAKIHEVGDGDDPEVHGVGCATAVGPWGGGNIRHWGE